MVPLFKPGNRSWENPWEPEENNIAGCQNDRSPFQPRFGCKISPNYWKFGWYAFTLAGWIFYRENFPTMAALGSHIYRWVDVKSRKWTNFEAKHHPCWKGKSSSNQTSIFLAFKNVNFLQGVKMCKVRVSLIPNIQVLPLEMEVNSVWKSHMKLHHNKAIREKKRKITLNENEKICGPNCQTFTLEVLVGFFGKCRWNWGTIWSYQQRLTPVYGPILSCCLSFTNENAKQKPTDSRKITIERLAKVQQISMYLLARLLPPSVVRSKAALWMTSGKSSRCFVVRSPGIAGNYLKGMREKTQFQRFFWGIIGQSSKNVISVTSGCRKLI